MPTTRRLAELFRAIASDDITGAASIAAQICKGEELKGHRTAARLLRGALSANGHKAPGPESRVDLGSSNGRGFLPAAIVQLPTDARLDDLVLAPNARRELDAVVLEWKHRDRLRNRSVPRRAKLLFYGPPGCGKSVTARAMGRELHLPVYLVRFDAIIGAYLGQTAIHLRQLFHFSETTPCILLLDELDALGKRRGNPLDVGELDRIVIALMQELEHSKPAGLIVGTSNLAKHLDDALWRRFDLTLLFAKPSRSALVGYIKRMETNSHISLPKKVLGMAAASRSFADAESVVIAELRRQVLRIDKGR